MDPARERVFSLLLGQAKRFPDLRLAELETRGLPSRDAALAHAIYDASVRRWLTLRFLIERHLTGEWRRIHYAAQGALIAGAAQIVFLDRVPPHAAVSQSVQWVNHIVGKRGGGLVNAVLRRVAADLLWEEAETAPRLAPDGTLEEPAPGEKAALRPRVYRERWSGERDELPLADGRALVLAGPILPEDTLQRLAAATSHPIELLRSWASTVGVREVRHLAHHGVALPPIILNTRFAQADLPPHLLPHAAPGHHVWTGSHEELVAMLESRRDVWVQDPASSLAVESIMDLKPALVVDMCGGLGTKTRQLANAFPDAAIVATDIDTVRFRTLRETFPEGGNVRVVPFEKLAEWAEKADLVLLDVPCSNSGVGARRVEARYRFDRERTEGLLQSQRQIIADALRLLGPRCSGRGLLYSTCSLDKRENEEQARWAARWHGFEVERERRRLPSGGPGQGPEEYSDGSYAALLRWK